MLKFAFYISHHGFGHTTRMAALAKEFNEFGIFVYIRSAKPDYLFQDLNPHLYEKEDTICDVGVKHKANLEPDKAATRLALLQLMGKRQEIIDREVDFLRKEKVDLIITDIPWLPVEAGTYAEIPVFAISNFDWLYIYDKLFSKQTDLKPVLNTIYGLYQRVDYAFRLPLSSTKSMGSFRKIEKTGLLAAYKPPNPELKKALGIDSKIPVLTCSFGGEGEMNLNWKNMCSAFPGTVISTRELKEIPNYIQIPPDFDFSSLISISDILLTKPGYGSFAEAIQSGTFLIYYPRKDYPEEEVLIKGISSYPQKIQLPELNLSVSEWKNLFHTALTFSGHRKIIPNRNKQVASLILQRYIELHYSQKKLNSIFDIGSNNLNYALCEAGKSVPVHTAQIKTGIGREYKIVKGTVRIKREAIKRFKSLVSNFMAYDQNIPSSKFVIATGIHRQSPQLQQLSEWFNKKWKAKYKLLKEGEEAELAYLAAKDLIPDKQSAIIIDIGGFSTQFIYSEPDSNIDKMSIPIGLLTIRKTVQEGKKLKNVLDKIAKSIPFWKADMIICVGLTATFLAKIVKRSRYYRPDELNGCRISLKELLTLKDILASGKNEEMANYAMEPESLDILYYSIQYYIFLLDRLQSSGFLVCYYGIATGYNQKLNKINKR